MISRSVLRKVYGLSVREAEFVAEYLKEQGEVEDYMMPYVIVNIRAALSILDAAFDKTYTLSDMRAGYAYIPNKTGNMLLDSMSFHGVKTL